MEESAKDPKQVAQEILNKSGDEEYARKVKNARIVLIILGIINFLMGLYYYSKPLTELDGYVGMAVGAIFIGLFFVGIKKPMLALVSGLVIFLSLHILSAIVDPSTIIKGIILKIIFIVLLVRGIISVNELPKTKPDADSELLDDI